MNGDIARPVVVGIDGSGEADVAALRTRLVLGSVGDALIRQATCPVAVVPGDVD